MPVKIIALEGIDQSGKRTQTLRLEKRLKHFGFKVKTVSFPIYKSPSGSLIGRYLKGEQKYPTQALHMLYSLNRWENEELVKGSAREAEFLIADRYTPSNLAYGVAKGLDLKWLLNLDTGLPQPDLVVVLDVPVTSSFARKSEQRDVHEEDTELLVQVNRSYARLGKKLGWKTVNGEMSVKEVESAVWKIACQKFRISAK